MSLLGYIVAALGWTLLAILAVAVAALAVPLDARYDSTHPNRSLRVTWLWGGILLYPRERAKAGKKAEEKAGRRRDRQKNRKKKTPNRRRRRELIALIRDPGFRERLLNDIARLLRPLVSPTFDLCLRFGLEDPGDTGLLYGVLSGMIAAVGGDPESKTGPEERKLRVEPVFDRETLALLGHARLRLLPIAVIGTAVGVGLGPTGRRVAGVLWRTRNR